MKAEFVINGSIKIVLIPESDMEKMLIEQFSKHECESILIDKQTALLDKVVHNGLILKSE